MSLPLHVDVEVSESLQILVIVFIQVTLDLGEVIDCSHRIHLLLVQLEHELDVAVLPPGDHGPPLHPEVHSDEDASPVVLGPSLLMHERTVSVEAASERPDLKRVRQMASGHKIALMLL